MDMNNTDKLSNFEISLRTGWKDSEKLLLWEHVRQAQKAGAPLKQVFEAVAERTGRKPNSVRNYYYMKVKETGEIERKPQAFVPFSKEEVYFLLRELLSAGAKGESVRGASLRLAGGDKTLMLRYQNKYRSLIKSQRSLVKKVMEDLGSEGIRYANPFERRKAAGSKGDALTDGLIEQLSGGGVDAKSFLSSVKKMAGLAAACKSAEKKLRELSMINIELKKRNNELSSCVNELESKLKRETEKNAGAAKALRQLINLCSAKEISELAGLPEWLKEGALSGA